MTRPGRLRTHVQLLSYKFELCAVFFGMLSIYENKSRVHVGLVQVPGRCYCDLLAQAVLASRLVPLIDFSQYS